jgi:hypothetical protein
VFPSRARRDFARSHRNRRDSAQEMREGQRGNTRDFSIGLRNPPIASGKILSRNRELARRVSTVCALARRFGTNVAFALR